MTSLGGGIEGAWGDTPQAQLDLDSNDLDPVTTCMFAKIRGYGPILLHAKVPQRTPWIEKYA